MGGMLTTPVTDKSSSEGEGLGLRFGLSSMQGWRAEMEDAHDVRIGLRYGLDDWSSFAVFDGHAGKRAAAFAASNLIDFILRDSQFELETGDSSDHMYIEPDIEKPNDALRVENSSNRPSVSSNGDEKNILEKSNQDTKSDDSNPTTNSGSKTKSENVEPTSTKKPDSQSNIQKIGNSDDDEGVSKTDPQQGSQDTPVPKSKPLSLPIIKEPDMVINAIKSGFLRIDQSMRASSQDMSGCTAICALISPTHLFIANCGDSRAVLYDGNVHWPRFVTEDHKPSLPAERRRIIDAGGCATQRINGTLAVSRALGDFDFKKDELRGPCEQLVSPEPEVTVFERSPQDQFLILACDGIWDVIDNKSLCEFVEYKLKVEPSLEKVCSSVLDLCLRKHSRDNMSIIIVVFENGPRFSEEELKRDRENDEALIKVAEQFVGMYRDEFSDFFFHLTSVADRDHSSQLPPGGGITAKYDLALDVYKKKFPESRITS